MQFLAPLFLAALAAVAVPLVLHLIQREKREAEPFPSLMFLRQIPHKSTRKRRLRDLPLLALRVFALVLIALAFSRPLLERGAGAGAAEGGAREVVLLLDRSYSMGIAGRWEAAQRAALAEVDALGPADRMSVIAFDGSAAVLAQPTAEAARLRSLIEAVRPGAGTTRYDPAIRLAANLLAPSDRARREVVLVSDLQRAGLGDGLAAKLPAGTEVRTVPLPAASAANLAVADVTFRRERFERQERVTATARIVNPSDVAVSNVPVTLELDGRVVRTEPVSVAAHGAATLALPPFTLSRPLRGAVSVPADALPADDAHGFVLAPGAAVSVLALDGGRGESLYLGRALEVGGEPGFALRVQRGAAIGDLRDVDVVVLNGGAAPAGDAARRLQAFVEQGGGLVVVLGPGSGTGGALAALLPGAVGQVADRTQGGGASLGYLDLEHPVFEVFRAPRSGDLSAPRFYRYRPVQVRTADSAVSVLARFDDGSAALAERRLGRGRVLAWASTLDREWNDLAVQPVYVPFVHRLLRYAAGFEPPRAARMVGEVVDARAAAGAAPDTELLVTSPDGTRRPLAAGERALPLEQRGWYAVRAAGGSSDAVLATIAANVDVAESELAALESAAFAASVRTPGESAPVAAAASLTLVERERRQSLWWYLLVGAVALLAIETALSNRASRRAVRAREVG